MSKLQSSLQKAIKKSRGNQLAGERQRARSNGGNIGGSFGALRRTNPHDDVMEESRVVAATDDRTAKNAYNLLRTRVLQRLRANDWKSLVVTSPGAGDGKTLTAMNLAMSLSRDVNQSTILIDLDLTRSSVAKYLGINVEIEAGIGDFLVGNAEFGEITYSPVDYDRLVIVPNREPVENSSDLISGPRMKEFLAQLRGQAENAIVIFDMPPVLANDDVLAFCPNADSILLIVAQGKTERVALEKTTKMLSDFNVLGAVLNMSDEIESDSDYGYY